MQSIALYRLPHHTRPMIVVADDAMTAAFTSVEHLNGLQGFVLSPFKCDIQHPVILIQSTPRPYQCGELDHYSFHEGPDATPEHIQKDTYMKNFDTFVAAIRKGRFQKLVLSRNTSLSLPVPGQHPVQLFERACHAYPRMMIALVSTPHAGTWLMATPEVLLQGKDGQWHTMALAGTMKLTEEMNDFDVPIGNVSRLPQWQEKDIREQEVVKAYLHDCLSEISTYMKQDSTTTVRAGALLHLRNIFTFGLQDNQHLGHILGRLHPTPAVCGMPKQEAFRFILEQETCRRSYYSGFAGLLQPEGETHIYVTLRCMQYHPTHCTLYAGGGLMPESKMENEWTETAYKMETMKACIVR